LPEIDEYIIDLSAVEEPVLIEVPEEETITLEMINNEVIINSELYIEKSVINAKGDLIVGNENAEPMRMPIGEPDYFAIVDPSQDRGFKYTNEIDGGTF